MPCILKQGLNLINFKISNSWGGFQMAARLLDPNTMQVMDDVTVVKED